MTKKVAKSKSGIAVVENNGDIQQNNSLASKGSLKWVVGTIIAIVGVIYTIMQYYKE